MKVLKILREILLTFETININLRHLVAAQNSTIGALNHIQQQINDFSNGLSYSNIGHSHQISTNTMYTNGPQYTDSLNIVINELDAKLNGTNNNERDLRLKNPYCDDPNCGCHNDPQFQEIYNSMGLPRLSNP